MTHFLQPMFPRFMLLIAACFAFPAYAVYPDRPIRLVVPFAPGGPTDVLARVLAQRLQLSLGQPVITDNKPGAGTNIAAELVAKSPADGYTLLLMLVGTQAINQTMYPKLRYDTVKDFSPIAITASSSPMLVAHPGVSIKSFRDLVTYAKANPEKLHFGSPGSGTPQHLGGELLNNRAGITLMHVPYKGAAPALNDVLGGQIELAIVGTPSALPYVKSGKLIAIGVTGSKRDPGAPNVPAISEFLPGYQVDLVYAVVAPAGTPRPVIARLNGDITKALNDADTRARLLDQGFKVQTSTPEQLGEYIKSDIEKWAPIVKSTGVKPE